MGKKLDSMIKLGGMGFNTPHFEAVESMDDWEKNKELFRRWDKLSLRTDLVNKQEDTFKLPFHPNQEYQSARRLTEVILKNPKYIVIVQKALDPLDSILGGKYTRWHEKTLDRIEFFMGPGTVRDMENGSVELYGINLMFVPGFPTDQVPIGAVQYIGAMQTMRMRGDLITYPFTLEWSIYPKKVGKNEKNMIFWELIEH